MAHPRPSKVINRRQKPYKGISEFFSCLAHTVQPGLGFCRESEQEEERAGPAGRKTGGEAIPPAAGERYQLLPRYYQHIICRPPKASDNLSPSFREGYGVGRGVLGAMLLPLLTPVGFGHNLAGNNSNSSFFFPFKKEVVVTAMCTNTLKNN